jgi:aminobenzoyl-glutamate utilization protein B
VVGRTPGSARVPLDPLFARIGRKGMVVAAKALVLTAIDLFTDPAQVAAARASFEKRRAGFEYRSRIPAGQKPPLNYRDSK